MREYPTATSVAMVPLQHKLFILPIGYRLQDYTITKVLSTGGFSFVYLAKDSEDNTVAIKEYMPTGLALREEGSTVILGSEEDSKLFKHGLKCFFEEGLTLAKIDHENIVRVTNFFRENNTVYMVMQYERGKSLQDYILSESEPVSDTICTACFWPTAQRPKRSAFTKTHALRYQACEYLYSFRWLTSIVRLWLR